MSAEVLELSGNAARDSRSSTINSHCIMLAIRNDAELDATIPGDFRDGGVLPRPAAGLGDNLPHEASLFDPIFLDALLNAPRNILVDPRDGGHYGFSEEDAAVVPLGMLDRASGLSRRQRMVRARLLLSEENRRLVESEAPRDVCADVAGLHCGAYFSLKRAIVGRAQRHVHTLIPKNMLRAAIMEMFRDQFGANNITLCSEEAFNMLHVASESLIIKVLQKAMLAANECHRKIVLVQDIRLFNSMTGDY